MSETTGSNGDGEAVTAQTVADLLKQIAEQTVSIYGPALGRMVGDELAAVWRLLTDQRTDEALAAIRDRMSLAELTAEKRWLTERTDHMATTAAERREALEDAFWAVLRAVVGALLAGLLA